MADSGWGCKSNGANPRWGCKSNFDGAVSPMGRYIHTNWGAQYRGAVSPASGRMSGCPRHVELRNYVRLLLNVELRNYVISRPIVERRVA